MGSIVSLLVILAVVAGICLVIFAVVRSVGSTPQKPWEGYAGRQQEPGSGERTAPREDA